jgi:hypothetical protein
MSKIGPVTDHAGGVLDQPADDVADPARIVAFTDDGQMLIRILAHKLGLAFHPAEVVERLIDDVAQRTLLPTNQFDLTVKPQDSEVRPFGPEALPSNYVRIR